MYLAQGCRPIQHSSMSYVSMKRRWDLVDPIWGASLVLNGYVHPLHASPKCIGGRIMAFFVIEVE